MKLSDEAGVELVLAAYAADPMTEDGLVKGVFVEGKSGRVAIKAKVVIDGTGDAGMAKRGGAPMITEVPFSDELCLLIRDKCLREDFPIWNETGLPILVAGVEMDPLKPHPGKRADGVLYSHSGLKGQFESNSMMQMSFLEKYMRWNAGCWVRRQVPPQLFLPLRKRLLRPLTSGLFRTT